MKEGKEMVVMKIDSLLLLAEYFSDKKEISFCLMYDDDSTGPRIRNLALYLDPRMTKGTDPSELVRRTERDIRILLNREDLAVICLNAADERLRQRVIETSVPVFCREERPMMDYCRRIFREDPRHNGKFKFTNLSGFGVLLAL